MMIDDGAEPRYASGAGRRGAVMTDVLTLLTSARAALGTGDYDDARAQLDIAIALIDATRAPAMSQAMALMTSNASTEWYTPEWVIARARGVLGTIDLDPASCAVANTTVQATRYYTQADDGVMQPWVGRIWCNPPFDDMPRWAGRARAAWADRECTAILFLCNAVPGYNWYEELIDAAPQVVQIRRRTSFIPGASDQASSKAKKGQAIAYFGDDVARFTAVFGADGRMLKAAGVAE